MVTRISKQGFDISQIEQALRANQESVGRQSSVSSGSSATSSFADMLKEGIGQVNESLQTADKSAIDLATGKNTNIHETMLAATKAELGFNMMVQLRNKAIESYQEVMRMQV